MFRQRAQNGKPRAVKLSLQSILREEYRDDFVAHVNLWCHDATTISVLGSLLFLFKTNTAFDNDDHNYFHGNGSTIIKECFESVLHGHTHTLPFAFRQMVEETVPNFQWPERHGMGNSFNYLVDQYTTNVKNNVKVWSYSRIKTFFTMQRYELNLFGHTITDIDVKNATKAVMFNNITPTENVNRLLQQARMIGVPVGERLCDLVRSNWMQMLPIFINIQRQVFHHHNRFQLLNDAFRRHRRDPANNPEPRVKRPPKIRNFVVIPVHDYHLKHIRIDSHCFYQLACKLGALKLAKGKRDQATNIGKRDYDSNLWYYWDQVFNMHKIAQIGKSKKAFDFAIVTDSVAVSLCYLRDECPSYQYTNEQIKTMYENNQFHFVLGMDPGVRTWNATVRKHILSGVEENFTINGPKYHFRAKYGKRKRKSEKWAKQFTEMEQQDRSRYAFYPTPKGRSNWMFYIQHRVKMMQPGMQVYSMRKYVHLRLDKYIEENRASDSIAVFLTRKLPSLIFIGSANIASNSPIGIKKRLRCPGVRKLINSFKKLGICVIRLIDEFNTSQTCAKCFNGFDRRTRKDRYKVCHQCVPSAEIITPANHLSKVIISKMSNRQYQQERRHVVDGYRQRNVHPVYSHGLVPKLTQWFKNWQLNADNTWNDSRHPHQLKTVWHRDIVAAKCILYKGLCIILGLAMHPRLSRSAVPAPVPIPAAQNNGQEVNENDVSDSDDDNDGYVYVLADEDDDE